MDSLESRLQVAMNGTLVRDIHLNDLAEKMTTLISTTEIMLGYQTHDAKDICILASKLVADIQESYSYLTIDEISICFELGVKGMWGDFQGANLRTFTKWLKGYRYSDLRYNVKMQIEKEKERLSLPPISEEYKQEHEHNFLRNVFQQYKNGYPLDRLYPARVYLSLQELGCIKNTPEEKWEAMRMFANWKPKTNKRIDEERRQELIRQQAMTYLLKQYFDSLISKAG